MIVKTCLYRPYLHKLSALIFFLILFKAICFSAEPDSKITSSKIKWPSSTLKPAKHLSTKTAQFLLKPELDTIIMIDPGHGGKDLGAHSKKAPKYQEKFLTLTTAFMLREYLTKMGYAVLLTRSNDTFVSLNQRAEFCNKQEPKIFVSIHFNSAPNTAAEGIEIFYFRSKDDKTRTKESELLSKTILKCIITHTEAKSRGIKSGNLAVIRDTNVPAVLIEGGFLTNADEVLKIKDGSYLKKLAWGIAQGINEYLEP